MRVSTRGLDGRPLLTPSCWVKLCRMSARKLTTAFLLLFATVHLYFWNQWFILFLLIVPFVYLKWIKLLFFDLPLFHSTNTVAHILKCSEPRGSFSQKPIAPVQTLVQGELKPPAEGAGPPRLAVPRLPSPVRAGKVRLLQPALIHTHSRNNYKY